MNLLIGSLNYTFGPDLQIHIFHFSKNKDLFLYQLVNIVLTH